MGTKTLDEIRADLATARAATRVAGQTQGLGSWSLEYDLDDLDEMIVRFYEAYGERGVTVDSENMESQGTDNAGDEVKLAVLRVESSHPSIIAQFYATGNVLGSNFPKSVLLGSG